jgi:hypothetical protein
MKNLFLDEESFNKVAHYLWLSLYDVEQSNRTLAENIWDDTIDWKTTDQMCFDLIDDIVHPVEEIRNAGASALSHAVKQYHNKISKQIISSLIEKYDTYILIAKEAKALAESRKDQFGRSNPDDIELIDDWQSRMGIALAIKNLAENIPSESVLELFDFFVNRSFDDENELVKSSMLEASIAALNYHGRNNINDLLPLFEKYFFKFKFFSHFCSSF